MLAVGYARSLSAPRRPAANKGGSRDRAGAVGAQGQETLGAILTAASVIASKEGLEQLSMRRLASAVGMSKSGLYAHFTSKEELQLATIKHVFEVFEAKVVRGPPEESAGGLSALLERWLDYFEHRVFPGGCFMIIAAVEFATRRGPVRDALRAAIDRELAVLETAIRRANETGEVGRKLDPSQTAFELHSILTEGHALFQVNKDPDAFQRARAAIQRLVG